MNTWMDGGILYKKIQMCSRHESRSNHDLAESRPHRAILLLYNKPFTQAFTFKTIGMCLLACF